MSKSLLVIGTGGDSRFDFLESLKQLFTNIVVLDCPVSGLTRYPEGVAVHRFDELGRQQLSDYLEVTDERFDRVATIFEPCVMGAAFVREQRGVPGLHMDAARVFRSKSAMARFLDSAGLGQPGFAVYREGHANREFFEFLEGPGSWRDLILRPDSGYGNLGVRKILQGTSRGQFDQALLDAKGDMQQNQYAAADFDPTQDTWILSEFLAGKELEIDLYVVDGGIVFSGIHEKTVIRVDGQFIEENNAVTPPVTLTAEESDRVTEYCHELSRALYHGVHKPAGNRVFHLYCEVMLVDDEVFCLEFADRVGGGYVPYSIKKSTGVDLFDLAAACCAQTPIYPGPQDLPSGVYWQLIYSPRKGFFRGIGNRGAAADSEVLYIAKDRFPVSVPHTDYVAAFAFDGRDSRDASERARRVLQELSVRVSETPQGPPQEFSIPLPSVCAHVP